MPIPSLTELTSGQAQPELAFGSGYAGGVPPLDIDFSNTEKRIQEISDAAAKQKKEDKAQFEKNLASKLQSINKFDGILPRDKEELLKLNQQVSAEIIKNSDLLAAGAMSKKGNAERQQKLDMLINDYVVKVEKSKQDKKFEDELRMTIRQKPEYNNEETLSLLEEWRTKPVDERMPFMPIDSGDDELLDKEKEFYKTPKDVLTKVEPVVGDPMSYYSATYGVFDKEKYRNTFKAAKGDFYANKYRRSPELQEEWKDKGGFDGYINSIADANMKGGDESNAILIQRVQKSRNESMAEKGRNERADKALEASWNRTKFVQGSVDKRNTNKPVKLTQEQKNSQYVDEMVGILGDIDGEWNIKRDGLVKGYPIFDNFIPKDIYSIEQLPKNSTGVSMSSVFSGGKEQDGDAYGVIFRFTKKKGDILYAPAQEVYTYKSGGETKTTTSKKEAESAYGDKTKIIVPNTDEAFTPEHFAMRLLKISDVKSGLQEETDDENETENTTPQNTQGKKRKPLNQHTK